MKHLITKVCSLGLGIVLCACATENKSLNQKVAGETQIEERRDLQVEADYLIQNSKTLSEVQKASLIELRKTTKAQLDDLEHQSLKLRAVLLKSVLSDKFDRKEAKAIKAQLKKVEDHKLATIFDTVDKANAIIGRTKLGGQDPVFTNFFIYDTIKTGH